MKHIHVTIQKIRVFCMYFAHADDIFVYIYCEEYFIYYNISIYAIFIIYRPGTRGIRRNISRSDDIVLSHAALRNHEFE
jgi:hypothetical protein